MKRLLLCTALLLIALPPLFAEEEEEGGDKSTGLPAAYHDFLIGGKTVSPNEKFAVIYPTSDVCDDEPKAGEVNRCQDYLVQLQPFEILTKLETKWPYFKNESHGGLSAEWQKDNSAVLVTLDSKWGPGEVFLYEFKDGKLTRSTNLLEQAHAALMPAYKKSHVGRYNDYFDFIFEDDQDETPLCAFADSGHVRIRGHATNDPKGLEKRVWHGGIEGTWDIAAHKFSAKKIKG